LNACQGPKSRLGRNGRITTEISSRRSSAVSSRSSMRASQPCSVVLISSNSVATTAAAAARVRSPWVAWAPSRKVSSSAISVVMLMSESGSTGVVRM
jgi:hypothetical protein